MGSQPAAAMLVPFLQRRVAGAIVIGEEINRIGQQPDRQYQADHQ
jgi:hypothetical protein